MQGDMHKVNAAHLKRSAYLYIRQSTPRQVLENTESTKRQYALRQRVLALGWQPDRIVLIDSDLGHSAALAADREGFQRLVGEVGMGRAGLVIGLEVSRLARNSSDWHRLLEICALTDTLILDEDGLYDPTNFNDRLLLGLKGAMSEAELHVMQARMRGSSTGQSSTRGIARATPCRFRLRRAGAGGFGSRSASATEHPVFVSVLPPPEFRVWGGESLPRGEATVSPKAERWTATR